MKSLALVVMYFQRQSSGWTQPRLLMNHGVGGFAVCFAVPKYPAPELCPMHGFCEGIKEHSSGCRGVPKKLADKCPLLYDWPQVWRKL